MEQAKIDAVFATLRKIHTAHWKAPKSQIVENEIKRTGAFVFRIGSNPWVAQVVITGESVDYQVNPNLPERMKKRAEEFKQKFKIEHSK